MPVNETLTQRVREALAGKTNTLEETKMFSGVCFMVNEKMCVCANDDGLLCRIGSAQIPKALEKDGIKQMFMKSRPMKDYVYVSEDVIVVDKDFEYWINLSLSFNNEAKSSKSKRKSPKSE